MWKWVVHDDPGRQTPAEALDGLAEEGQEGFAVGVGAEDGFPLVAARGDVIDGAGIFDAYRSCHAPRIPRRRGIAEESLLRSVKRPLNATESTICLRPVD